MYAIVLSKDNQYAITASLYGSIKVTNLQTKQTIHTYTNVDGRSSPVYGIAPLQKHGTFVSTSSFDLPISQQIYRFAGNTDSTLLQPKSSSSKAMSVGVSNNGRFIVSGHFDGSFRFYDLLGIDSSLRLYMHTGIYNVFNEE